MQYAVLRGELGVHCLSQCDAGSMKQGKPLRITLLEVSDTPFRFNVRKGTEDSWELYDIVFEVERKLLEMDAVFLLPSPACFFNTAITGVKFTTQKSQKW